MSKIITEEKKRFLVIASVGDTSLHRKWINPAVRVNFDLCLSYHGSIPGRYAEDCAIYFEGTGDSGFKYPSIKLIAQTLGERLFQYDAVWMPDESIDTNAADISRMFDLFAKHELALAQPSLKQDSHFSHAVTLQNDEFELRYVHFVEAIAPLFSKDALRICLSTFNESKSSWGLDLLWPKLLGYPHKKIALIDETPVRHTRPAEGSGLSNLAGVSPRDDLKHIERKYRVSLASAREPHYDGVLRGRKIIYSLLAHHNEEVLAAQIDNLRRFNPDAAIVLYNGGSNKRLGQNLGVPVCPYSRPLKYGSLAPFMLDTMVWLEENDVQYDYLINLDHDVLCIKSGFGNYLDVIMGSNDCMGWGLVSTYKPNDVPNLAGLQTVWKEWSIWQPIFGTDHFLRYFNPVQTYRKELVRRILAAVDIRKLRRLLEQTQSFAMEEVLFVTLAKACGAKIGKYPCDRFVEEAMRWGRDIRRSEAYRSIHRPYYYWIHPVKDKRLLGLSRWLKNGARNPAELKKSMSSKTTGVFKKRQLPPSKKRHL